ncbi:MAG: 4'-phosphopantetheinyl transferase superfamily protein [Cyanobacteria bacterium J06642_11]
MDQLPISSPAHCPDWLATSQGSHTSLGAQSVDLWRIPLDCSPSTQWLSDDELARLQRYRFERDQRRFAVARSSLRRILGFYTHTHPKDIGFTYSDRGKPSLQDNRHGIQFNLSHSGEYALCGVAQQPLGVDIEQLRSMDRLDGLIQRCLAPSEQATLSQVAANQKSQAFLEYWTCKEAYLKATGQGISESLTAIEIELQPTPKLKLPDSASWQLRSLMPCVGYTAALVIHPDVNQLRFWAYQAEPTKD